jgi:hypothetical protein
MAMSKIRYIAAQILRAAGDLSSDVRLNNPAFAHAEPHAAERELARFIQDRGYKELSAREAAALAFGVACAVLKQQKIEDGFSLEIDDTAVLPFASAPARKLMKGAA